MTSINVLNVTVPNPASASSTVPTVSPTNVTGTPTTDATGTAPPTNVKTNVFGAFSNFLNSIVGAGIIGMPYAMRHCGLVMGLFLLIFVGFLTDISVRMMVEMGIDLECMNYEHLAKKIFGQRGYTVITVFMFFIAFGAMIAYCIIIGDVVPAIMGWEETAEVRAGSMIVCSLLVMYPLALLKDMSSLAFTSTASVVADMILVCIVVAKAPIGDAVEAAGGFGAVLGSSIIRPKTLFSGLGAISFAFICHHSSFIVANSLENPTKERWAKVTHMSVGAACVMCVFLGVFGYLGFLDETVGDVLNNFDDSNIMTAARVMLGLTMFFTYPMESFVARHCVVALVYGEDAGEDACTLVVELPFCKQAGTCSARSARQRLQTRSLSFDNLPPQDLTLRS